VARKNYAWEDNKAKLEIHSRKKHDILCRYFRQYLITRCQLPQQEKFKLAIVDGFSGAGLYDGDNYGSPLIFVDTLGKTTHEINLGRKNQGFRAITIDCLLILNDSDTEAINLLKKNLSPLLIQAKETSPYLNINVEYFNSSFEKIYPTIKSHINTFNTNNVIFNLDQCGYSKVNAIIIREILGTWRSAEVLLTFMIGSMLAYLSPQEERSRVPLEPEVREKVNLILNNMALLNKHQWLGEAEKIVFNYLQNCATYVSPFSINNPGGWHYWLMHFSNVHRARQVFNDILHQDGSLQAHFGKAGLNMLSYDPQNEGQLYLFNEDSRQLAKEALSEDIPRLVSSLGKDILMETFYAKAYRETPAHSDDIHEAMINSPEIEIITKKGGKRRASKSINKEDMLTITKQRSFFFVKK